MKPQTFAGWLEGELQRREWTKSDLARRVDVAPSMVSRWLAGTVPTTESCDLLADALGVDLDYVLYLAGHRPGEAPADPAKDALISLLRRVALTPERETLLRSMLESMIEVQTAAPATPARRARPSAPRQERLGA